LFESNFNINSKASMKNNQKLHFKAFKQLVFAALLTAFFGWPQLLFGQEPSTVCPPYTVCMGLTQVLACQCSPITFSGPGVIQNGSTYTFDSNLTGPGVFTLSGYCNGQSPDFTVTVVPALNVLINNTNSSNITICNGASTNLLATGALTYAWLPTTGLSNPNIANPVASPTVTTTYTVTGTDANGCTDQATVTVTPIQHTMTISASDVTLCAGQSFTLGFNALLPGTTYFVTQNPGNSYTSTAANTIQTPPVTTTYTVGLNGYNCEVPASVTVQVFPQPSVTVTGTPASNGQCNGSVTATIVYAGNVNSLNIDWFLNGVLLLNEEGTSIANACSGNYSCTVAGPNNCYDTDGFIVVNQQVPAYNLVVGQDICNDGCGGSINITSQNNFTIQWGAPLNSTSASLTGLCAGTYTGTINFTGYAPYPITFAIAEAPGTPMAPVNSTITILNQNLIVQGDITINAGGTLNLNYSTVVVYGNIIVKPGGLLKVDNSTLKMQKNKGIQVQTGGFLNSLQGIYTNACANEFWMGIELWGNPLLAQIPANQGRASLSKENLIENAHKGICVGKNSGINNEVSNSGGGYFDITNCTFKNNRRDILFVKYTLGGLNNNNLSYCNRSHFIINTSAFFQNNTSYSAKDRVYMQGTNSVDFKGCDFHNYDYNLANQYSTLTAIRANGAPFKIEPFINQGTTYTSFIEGFNYGIYIANQVIQAPYTIFKTTFNCYRGIYASSLTAASKISENNFYPITESAGDFVEVPTPYLDTQTGDTYINNVNSSTDQNFKSAYGIYLIAPKVVTVANNYFDIIGSANVLRVSLYVNGNGDLNNDITSNYFGNMISGCRFYNKNRFGPLNGLQYSCNLFENNYRDVEIARAPGLTTTTDDSWGIKKTIGQGNPSNESRANDFYSSLSDIFWDDMYCFISGSTHTYYYATGELHPVEVSPNINDLSSQFIQPTTDCVLPSGNANLLQQMQDKLTQFNTLKNAHSNLVDGGNTTNVLTEVELAEYTDALELYYNLIQLSPALSREVMLEAIDKEYDLPAVLLTAILASNPSAAKDPAIQNQLNNRILPLTTYQRNMIDQGLYIMSLKESMEAEMGDIMAEYNKLLVEECNRVCEEESIVDKEAELEALMSLATDISSAWIKTMWYADAGKFNEAQILGQSLVALVGDKDERKADWQKYLELLNLAESLAALENPALTAAEQQILQEALLPALPYSHGLALNLLTRYSEFMDYEALDYGAEPEERSFSFPSNTTANAEWLSVYPNPTADYVSLKLMNAPLSKNSTYSLVDVLGNIIIQGNITNNNFEKIVDLSTLATGSYNLQIMDFGSTVHALKVIKL
jgi:hypothetical protein